MQTPPEKYFDGNNQWEGGHETAYSEAISEFDAADSALLMQYARYMDKPSAGRMYELQEASTDSFDAFSDVMVHVLPNLEDDEHEAAAILATMLCAMSRNHAQLINEYIDDGRIMGDDEELQDEIEAVTGMFEGYDREALAEAALDYLKEIRDGDMEAIEHYVIIKSDSPAAYAKERLIKGSIDIAKIGAGTLLGIFLYDKVFGK